MALLEARGIFKSFGHVRALEDASFRAEAGEITALIGDNGAGKSTLVKILSGVERPDSGEILFDGQAVSFRDPSDPKKHGIETVYQDLALAPELTAAANLFLGRETLRPRPLRWLGFIDRPAMRRLAAAQFETLGVALRSARVPVASLSGGQKQSVAIARAAMWADRLIFMDEPTAALGVLQTQRVLDLIKRVRDSGRAVVLISHNMPQVIDVADNVQVLRLGTRVAEFGSKPTVDQLVTAMTSGSIGVQE